MSWQISVIIPVYNGKNFVKQCIRSVQQQTMNNLQIIIVDDGSTDNTFEILQEYALDDSRIKVISQENGGVSIARNKGLSEAVGDWVIFIDADDRVAPTYCEDMLNAALELQSDVIIAHQRITEKEDAYILESRGSLIKACLAYDETKFDYNIDAPWGKIFRRSLIETHRIRFPENLSRSEDALFCATVYEHAASIGCLNRFGYVHVEREGSLCRRFAPDAPEMLEKILDQNRRWVQKYHPGEKDYEKALWYRALPGIDECEKTCFLHESNLDSRWIRMKKYDHFLRHGLVGYAIRQLKSKDILKPQYRIRLQIYKLHLGWLFLWMKMLR